MTDGGWAAALPVHPAAALGVGVLAASAAAVVGWLTPPAAALAAVLGAAVLAAGGWPQALALGIAFGITGLLEQRRDRIEHHAAERADARRGLVQVAANGAPLAVLAAMAGAWADAAFAGALAAAAGDTWATALGETTAGRPRSLKTGRSVAPGTPGAVSVPGLLATAAAGVVVFAVLAAVRWRTGDAYTSPGLLAAAVAGGVLGPLADGVLGSRWPSLGNDLVNLAGIVAGAAAAAGAWWLLAGQGAA